MNVLRAESLSGVGPYDMRYQFPEWFRYCSYGLQWMINRHNKSFQHPGPDADGIAISPEYVCGFDGPHKARNWFSPKDRKILEDNKFFISVYDVNPEFVKVGERQAIFVKGKAKLVDTFSPIKL